MNLTNEDRIRLNDELNNMQKNKLLIENAEYLDLHDTKKIGWCSRIISGDTADFIINYRGLYIKFECRLYGCDASELRGGDAAQQAAGVELRAPGETFARAEEVKDILSGFENKMWNLKFHGFCKYGRPLVTIYNKNWQNINEILIKEKLVKPYEKK